MSPSLVPVGDMGRIRKEGVAMAFRTAIARATFERGARPDKSVSTVVHKGPLTARIWLTGVVFCQIFLTPMAAFSITYLFDFEFASENFTMSFQTEMIPWIIAASLAYGMLALLLALISGGFTPMSVIERGGWKATLGLTRNKRDASLLRKARVNHSRTPHARMTVMVSDRLFKGHSLISTHGGLVLLAIPFQLLLVIIPLAVIIFLPESVIRESRRLEVALVVYLVVLIFVMRIFPKIARRNITAAAFTRRWLISMTRLSWLAPVLVLWLLGRLASVIVLSWMGTDVTANLHLEQTFMEGTLNIGRVPETSFLDLLTALAVMPLAAFTTLAVLGGGSGKPPEWMRIGDESKIKTKEEEGDGGVLFKGGKIISATTGAAIGIGAGLAMTAASAAASKTQMAANTAITAAQATPQALDSTSKSVDVGSEAFSFVDNAGSVTDVAENVAIEDTEQEETFEGFGSMFD